MTVLWEGPIEERAREAARLKKTLTEHEKRQFLRAALGDADAETADAFAGTPAEMLDGMLTIAVLEPNLLTELYDSIREGVQKGYL